MKAQEILNENLTEELTMKISGTATNNVFEKEYNENVIRSVSISVSENVIEKLLNILPEGWEDENTFTSSKGEGIAAGRVSIFPEAGELRVTNPLLKGARKGDELQFTVQYATEGDIVNFGKETVEVKTSGFQIIKLNNVTRNNKLNRIDDLMSLGLSRAEAVQILYSELVKA